LADRFLVSTTAVTTTARSSFRRPVGIPANVGDNLKGGARAAARSVAAIAALRCTMRRLPIVIAVFCFLCIGCGAPVQPERAQFVRKVQWAGHGVWLKIDTHTHTEFSDGAHTVNELAGMARKHGCDVLAITDHADRTRQAATPEYMASIIAARRSYPDLIILAGLEWNVPPWGGDEHATVLFPPGMDEFLQMTEFKRRFDDLGRKQHSSRRAEEALKWLEGVASSRSAGPVVFYNHPSRKAVSSETAAERMRRWRRINDRVVGFSGAPGHQRGTVTGSYRGPVELIDRWDPAAAEIGGSWDRLLQEGLNVWAARAPSDFHSPRNDYWPGEFSETWVYAADRTPKSVLRALRAGSFFAAHGHIVRRVRLRVDVGGLSRAAETGETIRVPQVTTAKVRVTFDVPERDWSGTANRIDLVELIAVDDQGARVVAEWTSHSRREILRANVPVPAGGTVLRARGRRIISSGPDLMFYTNPLRIECPAVAPSSLGPVKLFNWFSMRRLAGLTLAGLAVIALLVHLRRRAETSRGFKTGRRSRKPNKGRTVRRKNPAIVQRWHYAVAAILFGVAAVYGSWLPFEFSELGFADAVQTFRGMLANGWGSHYSKQDVAVNVLLTVPFAFCVMGAALLRQRGRWATASAVSGTAAVSVVLSFSVEFGQLWLAQRHSSLRDISAQLAGALIGVGLWVTTGRRVTDRLDEFLRTRHTSSRVEWLLNAYVIALIFWSLLPFDLVTSVNELARKLETNHVEVVPFSFPYASRLQFWYAVATDALIFLPVGIWAMLGWRRQGEEGAPRDVFSAVAVGICISAGIELLQLLIASRFTSTTDVLCGTVGVIAGVLAVHLRRQVTDRRGGIPPILLSPLGNAGMWVVAAFAYSAVVAAIFWAPFEVTQDGHLIRRRLHDFAGLPFRAMQASNSDVGSLFHVIRNFGWFAPLGALGGMAVHHASGAARSRTILSGLAVTFITAVALLIELGQIVMPEKTADLTETLVRTLGGCAGLFVTLIVLSRWRAGPL